MTLLRTCQVIATKPPIVPADFLSESAYRLVTDLVQAARELFNNGELRAIHRAHAATDPAVFKIKEIIHKAASERTRRLILLTGVPGAGKTLVGLSTVHAHYLDDLAVPRANGTPTAPAVFLSGNGPLVEVLQYELRGAGGGGKTFVRGVKEYVKRYSSRPDLFPSNTSLFSMKHREPSTPNRFKSKHVECSWIYGRKVRTGTLY